MIAGKSYQKKLKGSHFFFDETFSLSGFGTSLAERGIIYTFFVAKATSSYIKMM